MARFVPVLFLSVTYALVTSPMPCVMSMLVLHPSTSTMMFGENGGRVAVLVGEGASVKEVAVSVGVIGVAVSVAVPVGVSETTGGMVVFVMVTITGVTVKIEGVIVGGGAGNVGTV